MSATVVKMSQTSNKVVQRNTCRRPSWKFNACGLLVVSLLFIICICSAARGEDECLKSKVKCYECDSTKDDFCGDPFNMTEASINSMIVCEGCCVKVVRQRGKPQQTVWRTCTSRLHINLFMVDHVCMDESGGQGHMCFCETELCNSAPGIASPLCTRLLAISPSFVTLLLPGWRSSLSADFFRLFQYPSLLKLFSFSAYAVFALVFLCV